MRSLLAVLACIGSICAGAAYAADAPKEAPKDIVLKGDAKCTSCHDEADAPGVLHIGKTKHGTRADGRTPTCSDCHGDSEKHVNYKGSDKPPKPDRTFDKKSATPVAERNAACLSCHQTDPKRHLWAGSTHERRDVACSSCHDTHTANDKVRDKRTQAEVCFACHKEQRTQVNRPSHHPIPEGKMSCSDCHNPHGTTGPKLLVKDSTNATCFTCHAEKRGPFVHNHAPVTEDCANCHNPHGTVADAMLKARPPFLCQQCHDPANHLGTIPGVAGNTDLSRNVNGTVIPGQAAVQNNALNSVGVTQGRGCLNCHTEIHGSNNPANASKAVRFWR
ncbi:DmsE family decaheme c-type cytochrome [Aromatoleum toluvorans]|uniref:DmsE family decaheme c-type cytochrome n=1 Tax=Aromatoleum toluvorans TaxID=92002 RepID=A0ABX1PWU5_9RHOO|nr:DmsE family decaheme c-type cytochrome [Aromatoleum toluvorans]NMG43904.1 DmsE family decaheme c-type cytochrome [Aromatoleum toluvorans]